MAWQYQVYDQDYHLYNNQPETHCYLGRLKILAHLHISFLPVMLSMTLGFPALIWWADGYLESWWEVVAINLSVLAIYKFAIRPLKARYIPILTDVLRTFSQDKEFDEVRHLLDGQADIYKVLKRWCAINEALYYRSK